MERATGLARDDQPHVRLDKLDALLAQTSTSVEDVALFAEMLRLARSGIAELTRHQRATLGLG